MLESRLNEAQTLKRLLEGKFAPGKCLVFRRGFVLIGRNPKHLAIKDLVTDGNFDCDEEGIKLQAMDNSHVALVSVHLKVEGFSDYRCDRPLTLGVNIASLTKVLKCAKDDDEVVLMANDSADILRLVYNAKGMLPSFVWFYLSLLDGWYETDDSHYIFILASDRVAEYEIKLMDIDQETLGIPDTEYDAEVSMPSSEFTRLCRDLGALGESVRIEVNKEGVRFTSEGDSANGSVLMKPGSAVKSLGESSEKKPKIKKEEDEDAQMDEDASEDDGGVKAEDEDEENEEGEEDSSSKKRKRSKNSSEKVRKGKSKKAKTGDDDDDGESGGVRIAMNQQVNLTFSLKYLQNFAKSSSLCNRVTLSMSNDVPLLVSRRHTLQATR